MLYRADTPRLRSTTHNICFLIGQYKTRTADYGLRTGYKIRTRYKTRTGKYGLGIKRRLRTTGYGLRTGYEIRTTDYPLCPFWPGVGYGFRGNYGSVHEWTYLSFHFK